MATSARISTASSWIEDWARLCWRDDWADGRIAMLVAYFDASGHVEQQTVLVAGFVSTAADWVQFDSEWLARLKRDGLTHFHMQSFAQSCGEFDGWESDEARRRSLLQDLYAIIAAHGYRKFGTAILNSQLNSAASAEEQEQFCLTAYAMAGRGAADNAMQWAAQEGWKVPEFIFEDGDNGKGHLMSLMEQDNLPAPVFKPKIEKQRKYGETERALTPLQAADWLAYEYRLVLDRGDNYKPRWGYRQFDKMPGEIRKFSYADLRRVRDAKAIGIVEV